MQPPQKKVSHHSGRPGLNFMTHKHPQRGHSASRYSGVSLMQCMVQCVILGQGIRPPGTQTCAVLCLHHPHSCCSQQVMADCNSACRGSSWGEGLSRVIAW